MLSLQFSSIYSEEYFLKLKETPRKSTPGNFPDTPLGKIQKIIGKTTLNLLFFAVSTNPFKIF